MMGTIINGGILISIFAIAAPFIFVLLIISMVTKNRDKDKRFREMDDEEKETMYEIHKGLKDLNRRIENLETLYKKKNDKER